MPLVQDCAESLSVAHSPDVVISSDHKSEEVNPEVACI